ncbi:MAG: DUF1232 domain-containing protein [Rhodovulum sp.]|nr:DUF1232 domain-containing protein [Rhodovulum sp.]
MQHPPLVDQHRIDPAHQSRNAVDQPGRRRIGIAPRFCRAHLPHSPARRTRRLCCTRRHAHRPATPSVAPAAISTGSTMWHHIKARLIAWAQAVKRDVAALWRAAGDPRVPWLAKALAVVIASYALSPIDLIPDAVPVLGFLDDMILLPLGIALVVRLIPPAVMAEHRAAAEAGRPTCRAAAVVIVGLWGLSAIAGLWLLWRAVAG